MALCLKTFSVLSAMASASLLTMCVDTSLQTSQQVNACKQLLWGSIALRHKWIWSFPGASIGILAGLQLRHL